MNYNSHYGHGRRQNKPARYLALLAVLVVIASAIIFVGIKQIEQHPAWSKPVAEYYGRTASWIAERKKRFSQTAAAVRKNVEVGDESDRVVNFEFYNTLQEMQSMQSQVEAEMSQSNTAAKSGEKKPARLAAAMSPTVKQKAKKMVAITQAADLEKDVLAAIKQPMKQQGGDK